MGIKDILGKVADVAGIVNPTVGKAIDIVNGFLPGEKQLPKDATGQQVIDAAETLPVGKRRALEAELKHELEITQVEEHTKVVEALARVDEKGASTRPQIAQGCFQVCAAVTLMIVTAVSYTFATKGLSDADKVLQMGIGMAALLSPFWIIVRAYFGLRTRDKELRAAVALNQNIRENETEVGWFGKLARAVTG